MRLNVSRVQYDREAHTYTLDGVRLSGVTEMIKYQLQPDSYKGVSDYVLSKAAKKGSIVHDMCETFDNFGDIPSESDIEGYRNALIASGMGGEEADEEYSMRINARASVIEYSRLVEKNGFVCEASEYVVSDNRHFASPIDKVYRVDDHTVDIYDIKTISSLDSAAIEKVTWQDSIYARWFEEQNPGIKVRNIGVVWLPDEKYWTKTKKPMAKILERIPAEEVDRLLQCEVNDECYRENSVRRSDRNKDNLPSVTGSGVPIEIERMKDYVVSTLAQFKRAEAEKKQMISEVEKAMSQFNVKSWSTDGFVFSRSSDSQRKTLDMERLKEKYPDIDFTDESLYKVTNVKGSISVKLK